MSSKPLMPLQNSGGSSLQACPACNQVLSFWVTLKAEKIARVSYENEKWNFTYVNPTREVPGFPLTYKKYQSEILWPFFISRLPGLGRPEVRDLLKEKNIDSNTSLNKVYIELIKEFGVRRSITSKFQIKLDQ